MGCGHGSFDEFEKHLVVVIPEAGKHDSLECPVGENVGRILAQTRKLPFVYRCLQIIRIPSPLLARRFPQQTLEERLFGGTITGKRFAAVLVELIAPIESLPAVNHDLTGLRLIGQLSGQFLHEQPKFEFPFSCVLN